MRNNFAQSVISEIARTRPNRQCSGGPNSIRWCGKPATVVCTLWDGMQWYACDDKSHQVYVKIIPIEEWWKSLDNIAKPNS